MYVLVRARRFDRRLVRFLRAHPDLTDRLAQTLLDLQTDPFQAHLRLHPLRGELAGLYAASVTHAYRLVITGPIPLHNQCSWCYTGTAQPNMWRPPQADRRLRHGGPHA